MNKQIETINLQGGGYPSAKTPETGFLADVIAHLKVSIIAAITLTVIVCGIYPAIVWGLGQAMFRDQANGSLIGKDGKPVSDDKDAIGSALLGQAFSDAKYFHPRPSAAGNGYDSTASGGSNLGPTSAKLLFGTTKYLALTVFAGEKSHPAVVPVAGRIQGTAAEVTKNSVTITPPGSTSKARYSLDPAVADPNSTVNFHGRTVHATTIVPGAMVELKLNAKSNVAAMNVVDSELDGGVAAVDTSGNKITLTDAAATVVNVDPKNTLLVVSGKTNPQLGDITTDMVVHIVVSSVMDNDGVADRVIHYCQDNKIDYKAAVPDSAFTDADGIDDVKLITAFNAASVPVIAPRIAIPADAVTASASGLDPHISPANAKLQAQRVADTRKISVDKVNGLIDRYTEGPSLGFLGDPTVNVLRLNLALDQSATAKTP